jgi:hypothetical protein
MTGKDEGQIQGFLRQAQDKLFTAFRMTAFLRAVPG